MEVGKKTEIARSWGIFWMNTLGMVFGPAMEEEGQIAG